MNSLSLPIANLKALMQAGFLLGLGMLGSCATAPRETAQVSLEQRQAVEDQTVEPQVTQPKLSMTEWTLLEMGFDEAKAISAPSADVGSQFRVAADQIEVLKADAEGKPLKVKATGHVFVEMNIGDRATALCEEAEITAQQAVFKGRPLLMQNSQVAKATHPATTFRVTDFLKVSGDFEFIRPAEVMQSILMAADPLLPSAPNAVALH